MTKNHHVYMTKDGRISMAGLNSARAEYLARAIDDSVSGGGSNGPLCAVPCFVPLNIPCLRHKRFGERPLLPSACYAAICNECGVGHRAADIKNPVTISARPGLITRH